LGLTTIFVGSVQADEVLGNLLHCLLVPLDSLGVLVAVLAYHLLEHLLADAVHLIVRGWLLKPNLPSLELNRLHKYR